MWKHETNSSLNVLVLFHPYMRIFYSTIVLSTLITWFIFSNTILHIYIIYIIYILYIYTRSGFRSGSWHRVLKCYRNTMIMILIYIYIYAVKKGDNMPSRLMPINQLSHNNSCTWAHMMYVCTSLVPKN